MRAHSVIRARVIVPALLIGTSAAAFAQVSNASTAATGLSGAFTARATGYNAIAWNPANLAMPGNPGFSMTLLAFDGITSLKPIDLNKIADYQNKFVPASVRESWLKEVTSQGGQKGGANGGLTEFGLSMGSLAFSFNTKVNVDASLAPDAVEAILFGNAGRDTVNHTVKTLNLAGSSFGGSAYSTGAVSFALPLTSLVPLTNFSVGATVKYTVGHFLAMGLDGGSAIGTSNVNVNFPVVMTDPDSADGQAGKGIGIDLGAAWKMPGFRVGVTVQNITNSFKWDTTKLVTRSTTAFFSSDTSYSQVDSVNKPYATAPAALRQRVAAQKFKQVIAAGIAFDWLPKMTVSADVRQQVGDGIETGPKSMISGGLEYRIIPFIPLRAGGSVMTGGYGISAGVGVHLLGFEVGLAGFLHHRDNGTEPGATINVFSIRP